MSKANAEQLHALPPVQVAYTARNIVATIL
jgi:hypothetical protein